MNQVITKADWVVDQEEAPQPAEAAAVESRWTKMAAGSKHLVDQVRQKLAQRLERFDSDEDLRAVFTAVYEIATGAVQAKLEQPGNFDDPGWIDGLARRFACYYEEALAQYDGPEKAAVSEAWQRTFSAMGVGEHALIRCWRLTTLEALLLSIIVHTVHDLPLAVADELLKSGRPEAHIHDFEKINDVILQTIEKAQETVGKKYNPLLIHLDRWAGRQDELLTYHALQSLRGAAWFDAARLCAATQERARLRHELKACHRFIKLCGGRAAARPEPVADFDQTAARLQQADQKYYAIKASIEAHTLGYLDLILNPPWPLKIIRWGVRWLSGSYRAAAILLGGFRQVVRQE